MPKYLLITHQLTRTGAPQALLNLADRLSKKGNVMILCPEMGESFREVLELGYPVAIAPKYWERKFVFKGFAKKFDMVVANTVLNFPAVMILDGEKLPVYWWIHEHKSYFDYGKGEIPNPNSFKDNIHTLAVGDVVKDILKEEFDYDAELFSYGVKDYSDELKNVDTPAKSRPLNFLIIGPVTKEKGQDLFLRAYMSLPNGVKDRLRVTFIGAMPDINMAKQLNDAIEKEKNLSYLVPMPHDALMKMLAQSDGIIVPSRFEMLSTVSVEAMSLNKLVISANAGGISSYINSGENGYVYETENTASLNQLLTRLTVDGREKLIMLGEASRKIYDEVFSESAFDKRIERIMFNDEGGD
nr:glycosyltransferase family 4 protein [Lachnospiraceae bacterium]